MSLLSRLTFGLTGKPAEPAQPEVPVRSYDDDASKGADKLSEKIMKKFLERQIELNGMEFLADGGYRTKTWRRQDIYAEICRHAELSKERARHNNGHISRTSSLCEESDQKDATVSPSPRGAKAAAGPDDMSEKGVLKARDLHKLDSTFVTSSEPAILVRKHCIIFSAFSLKAVIMCHKCLLLTPAIGQMNAASLASMGHDNSVLAILLQRLVKGTKPLREREKKLSMGQNAIVTPPLAEGEIPPPPPPLVVPGPSSPRKDKKASKIELPTLPTMKEDEVLIKVETSKDTTNASTNTAATNANITASASSSSVSASASSSSANLLSGNTDNKDNKDADHSPAVSRPPSLLRMSSSKPGDPVPDSELEMRADSRGMAFEFIVLEALFMTLHDMVEQERDDLDQVMDPLRVAMRKNHTTDTIEHLKKAKKASTQVLTKIQGVRDSLANLLADDAAMCRMYLTDIFDDPDQWEERARLGKNEQIQAVLESYLADVDSVLTRVKLLAKEVEDTDDILNLKLDHIRNQLQGANLYIGVVTMCIGFAGVLLSGYVIYEDASLRNKIIVLGGTAFIMLAMIMCVMSNFARKGLLSTAV